MASNEHEHPDSVSIEVPDVKPGDSIVVDLDKPQDSKEAKPQQTEKYVTVEELKSIQKQMNGMSAALRNVEKISRQINELQSVISNPKVTPKEKLEAKDELDELVEVNWKKAVSKIADGVIEEKLKTLELQNQTRQAEYMTSQTLEKSKQEAASKHPELLDESSEKSQVYMRILNQHPEYLHNPYGPKLAMHDMEEELGIKSSVSKPQRINATYIPRSTSSSNPNRITLTPDQKEFCDHNGIKYEDYARNYKVVNNDKQTERVAE